MRLFFLMFTLTSTVLAGIGITTVLAAGFDGLTPILIAAGLGAAIALPAAWIISRKIAAL